MFDAGIGSAPVDDGCGLRILADHHGHHPRMQRIIPLTSQPLPRPDKPVGILRSFREGCPRLCGARRVPMLSAAARDQHKHRGKAWPRAPRNDRSISHHDNLPGYAPVLSGRERPTTPHSPYVRTNASAGPAPRRPHGTSCTRIMWDDRHRVSRDRARRGSTRGLSRGDYPARPPPSFTTDPCIDRESPDRRESGTSRNAPWCGRDVPNSSTLQPCRNPPRARCRGRSP